MVRVRVPASSANMGPGFDCLGVALNMYNEAEFIPIDSGLEIEIMDEAYFIPRGENNFVYKGFKRVFDELGQKVCPIHIKLWSNIPVTRGLGSSSSSIVLGLMGANALTGEKLSKSELLSLACEIEGHPDNVAAALMGGFTVACSDGGEVVCSKTDVSDNLHFAAMIPDFYLQTKKARMVLPNMIPFRNATYTIAHSSLIVSAFTSGNYSLLTMGVKDRLHQRYRFSKVRSGEFISRSMRRNGALCSYLSGAGPTIMVIVEGDYAQFYKKMNTLIQTNLSGWHLVMLSADNEGAKYIK